MDNVITQSICESIFVVMSLLYIFFSWIHNMDEVCTMIYIFCESISSMMLLSRSVYNSIITNNVVFRSIFVS
jgi:hypothetical protein